MEHASSCFQKELPHTHPAFEQAVLENHRAIYDKVSDIPNQTVDAMERRFAENKEQEESAQQTSPLGWMNPFSVIVADDLELSDPNDVNRIRSLFIARFTDLPTIRKHFNTILEGQRGTGKTMILKHLSFEIQITEWIEDNRPIEDFLTSAEGFIGVYVKLRQNAFDKPEYKSISDVANRNRIFEHRIVLELIDSTLDTMKSVYEHFVPDTQQFRRVRRRLSELLDADTLEECANIQELIEGAQDCIKFLSGKVDRHLGSIIPGRTPSDFSPHLTLSTQFVPLINLFRISIRASVPFFMMLDDFDVLEPFQQEALFSVAAARQTSIVCFKFGIMVLGNKTITSGPGRTFRSGDDYDWINLDWTEGGLHTNYSKSIREIAEARLREAGLPMDISTLLPEWEHGAVIREEVETKMREEWEAGRRTQSASEQISKYGNARYFQTLRQRKIPYRYAGYDNILAVSSGITRQFLEACKMIFDRARDDGWEPGTKGISPEIQDEAIREYSTQMVRHLTSTAGDLQNLLSEDTEVTSKHMLTLIDSLCDLFYAKLHLPNHGAPEVISIAVKGNLDDNLEAKTILDVAFRESILHRFTNGYKPKTAGGPRLPTYMLNRRLGPRRDLCILRMQGREELDPDDILLAAQTRGDFFAKHRPSDGDPSQLDLQTDLLR